MNTNPAPGRGERGVTLIEILVAVAIFAVAAIIALTVFDLSQKSFKKGENQTENQQAVRIAFDRLAADLRMTGFNYNPDGSKTRPDEQIEAAFDTAVVIRADFDAEDPVASLTPESTMHGTDFLSVSIGNDEIVAYVLAKQDGSSTDSLSFRADISNPRDGTLETVTIPNVAMVHDDPPYTLFRVTFNNDDGTFGSGAFFTRTPLIENVYSMSFRYYDQVGVQANSTFDLTTVADDIGGTEVPAARVARDGIRRFGIELVGMTRDPDMTWRDESDPIAATQPFRKFTLTSDIQPRNIGLVGIQDLNQDVTPPSQPGAPTLVEGHCGGLLVRWAPNPADEGVAYYRVNFSTASGTVGATRNSNNNYYYLGGLVHDTTYYVTIQAVDPAGNVSIPSVEVSETTTNSNQPSRPVNLVASTTLNGAVDLTWDPVTTNDSDSPSEDPASPRIRDLAGYRLYRDGNLLADESVLGVSTSPSFADTQVVNCRTYRYEVRAVDTCGVDSNDSDRADGNGTTAVLPATPGGLQAFFYGLKDVSLQWYPTETDVNEDAIFIDSYNVYRSDPLPVETLVPPDDAFKLRTTVTGLTEYVDPNGGDFLPGVYTRFYKVAAIDDCGNESVLSPPVQPLCAFSGSVVFDTPRDQQPVAGVVPVQVSVVGGSDVYTKVELTFRHRIDGTQTTVEVAGPGPSWVYDWLADPPGPYTITATVYNSLECGKSAEIDVAAGYDVGCCLSPPNPELKPIVMTCEGRGAVKCAALQYEVINNNCLTAVAVESMAIRWKDVTGNDPKLSGVLFDGSLIWNAIALSSPATNTFSDPKPTIGIDRDATDPVVVNYVFDNNMAERTPSGAQRNVLTTTYGFRLLDENGAPTSITGVCGPETGMFDDMIVEVP
jgi:prepilin-type N-terminal cleavage/methylation domain-containing protein